MLPRGATRWQLPEQPPKAHGLPSSARLFVGSTDAVVLPQTPSTASLPTGASHSPPSCRFAAAVNVVPVAVPSACPLCAEATPSPHRRRSKDRAVLAPGPIGVCLPCRIGRPRNQPQQPPLAGHYTRFPVNRGTALHPEPSKLVPKARETRRRRCPEKPIQRNSSLRGMRACRSVR